MNKETLELLLRQNLSTVKEFVCLMFDKLKKEVETLKNGNSELKQSLMFTQAELEDLKKSSKEHSKMIANISKEDTSMIDIFKRLRAMEDYSKRNNIVVDGIPERNDENNEKLQASVVNLFKEKLSIDPDIEVVYRIGRTLGDRPRSVMIKLRQYKHRQECLNSASKKTNVFLNEDVSKATMQIRKDETEISDITFMEDEIESVFASMISGNKKYIIGCVYRPPHSDIKLFFGEIG